MKQAIQTITTLLLLLLPLALGGCDQAQDLATQVVEKTKKDVISEITKTVNGVGQTGKEEGKSNKETDKKEGEEK